MVTIRDGPRAQSIIQRDQNFDYRDGIGNWGRAILIQLAELPSATYYITSTNGGETTITGNAASVGLRCQQTVVVTLRISGVPNQATN